MPQTATRPRCSTALLMWSLLGIGAVLAGASDLDQLQPRGGDALLELSPEERARFDAGKAAYARNFSETDGLGPIFNSLSCKACHGSQGGSSSTLVTQFGRMVDGTFDPMEDSGGPVRQALNLSSCSHEEIPEVEGGVVAERVTLGSMGYGLIEALTSDQILANETAQTANASDGISGRVHWVQSIEDPNGDPVAGRFGWKAQLPTVASFSMDAAFNELGLTSPLLPDENIANSAAGENACDTFPLGTPHLPDTPGP